MEAPSIEELPIIGKRLARAGTLVSLLCLLGSPAGVTADGDLSVEWLQLPDIAQGHSPRLDTTQDGLLLSWVVSDIDESALFYSRFEHGRWSPPDRVARGEGWLINRVDYAEVVSLSDDVMLAFWLEFTSLRDLDYRFDTKISRDAGKTWLHAGRPVLPEGGQHGFLSASLAGDDITIYWIGTTDGNGRLYRAHLDAAGNWSRRELVDDLVCSCCHTNVSSRDTLVYRDRTTAEIRDIAAITDARSNSTRVIVHADNWEIAGCPTNAPTIAEREKRLAIAWFTAADDEARTRLAIGRGNTPADLELVDLDLRHSRGFTGLSWLDDESLLLSAVSATDGKTSIDFVVVKDRSDSFDVQARYSLPVAGVTGTPVIAVQDGQVYLAYFDSVEKQIRMARIDLPHH